MSSKHVNLIFEFRLKYLQGNVILLFIHYRLKEKKDNVYFFFNETEGS